MLILGIYKRFMRIVLAIPSYTKREHCMYTCTQILVNLEKSLSQSILVFGLFEIV